MPFPPSPPGASATHKVGPWRNPRGNLPVYQLRPWRWFPSLFWGADVKSPAPMCCPVSRAHPDLLRRVFAMPVQHYALPGPGPCMLQEIAASSKATCCGAYPLFAWRGGFHSAQTTAGPDSWGQSDSKKLHCSFLTAQNHSRAVCSRP